MKAMKRILFITLCLCLALCTMSMGVLADETGSITIKDANLSSATVSGKTFNVYKVFNATVSGSNTSYSWYLDTDGDNLFYDFFFGSNGIVRDNANNASVQEAVAYINDLSDNVELSQFADDMHEYIVEKNIAPVATCTAESNVSSVKISDLTYGYYLVYDNTELSGAAVRSSVMLTNVNPDAEIFLKANRPSINKYVLENDGTTYGKGTSSMIGENVKFRIVTHVPSHMMYETYKFRIEDKLPVGLNLLDETIKVYNISKADYSKNMTLGDENLLDELKYDLDKNATDEYDFKVDFTKSMTGSSALEVDSILIVEYAAHVTVDILPQAPNVNTATLIYNNDPTNLDSTGEVFDTANVYSYQMVLTKFAEDANGAIINKRLAGAEFKLYKIDENNETLIKFTKKPVNVDGLTFNKYIVADEHITNGITEVLQVHDQGEETITLSGLNYGGYLGDITIFGLSEGVYKLVETKSPDGYILPDHPFMITINDTIGELGYVGQLQVTTEHSGQGAGHIVNAVAKSESILTVWAEITNTPGSALPETGGMGTTLFTVIGLVLMCAAGVFFAMKRRSHAK